MLSADFIPLFIYCHEAMDPISLMFVMTAMITVLKGFEMVSIPVRPFQSSSLIVILKCLGVTDSSLVLKLY